MIQPHIQKSPQIQATHLEVYNILTKNQDESSNEKVESIYYYTE